MSTSGRQTPAARISSSSPRERESDSWNIRFMRSWRLTRSRSASNCFVVMVFLSPFGPSPARRASSDHFHHGRRAAEDEDALLEVDLDPAARRELARQELHRERVLNLALQGTLERARAELGVEADLCEVPTGRGRERDLEALLRED